MMKLNEKIEIIRRMDLKVAVPQKYQPPSYYVNETITTVETPTIHVPSLIDELLHEIKMAQLQVDDIKRATRVLLDIKREQSEGLDISRSTAFSADFNEWYAAEGGKHDTAHGLALAAWEYAVLHGMDNISNKERRNRQ